MRRRLTAAAVVAAVLATISFAAPAEGGIKRSYSHAYWTVAHHISRKAAGRNLRRQGAPNAALAKDLHRLRRIVARAVPAWADSGMASWYDDAGSTACGSHYGYGVANKTLPCGSTVRMQRCGRTCSSGAGPVITVYVQDRGPFAGGRKWDLNPGAHAALGCNLCMVRTDRSG